MDFDKLCCAGDAIGWAYRDAYFATAFATIAIRGAARHDPRADRAAYVFGLRQAADASTVRAAKILRSEYVLE